MVNWTLLPAPALPLIKVRFPVSVQRFAACARATSAQIKSAHTIMSMSKIFFISPLPL